MPRKQKKSRMYISYLKCKICGFRFPIPRKRHKRRETNHIKDLWCVVCNERTPHIENIKGGTYVGSQG